MFGLHLLNLAAYALAWLAFERLMQRMDRLISWKSEAARGAFLFASCYAFLCCALYGVGTEEPSADMIVLALYVLATSLLLDLKIEAARPIRLVCLGAVIGSAYLAKTAMLPGGLLLCACGVQLSRKNRLRAALTVAAPLAILALPWILLISAHQGHWTIGESGKLNYAWEVDGAPRYFHWQGEPPEFGTPLHSTRQILKDPGVYEFAEPVRATYPPWYDPSYWNAGLRAPFEPARQLFSILVNGRYTLLLLALSPGLLAAFIAAAATRQFRQAARRLADYWYLAAPATALALMYCLVFVDRRYVAGQLFVLAATAMAAMMADLRSNGWSDAVRIFAVVSGFFLLSGSVLAGVKAILVEVLPASTDREIAAMKVSRQPQIAAELRAAGLAPGDRIAYIGAAVNAYWAYCDELRIVAELPVIHIKSATVIRGVKFGSTDVDRFWMGGPEVQSRVLASMKAAGARAVAADFIPSEADLSGWHVLQGKQFNIEQRERIAIRFLEP